MAETSQHNDTFYEQLLDEAPVLLGPRQVGNLALDNILSGKTYYRKSFFDQPLADLSYYLAILDSGAAGFAYHHGTPAEGAPVLDLINRDALEVLTSDTEIDFPLQVAILDSVYGEINKQAERKPDHVFRSSATYAEKADLRSQLVVGQLAESERVLLVGLVTQFVRDMLAKGIKVTISDMSPELADTEVCGVPIVNGGNDQTLARLALADAAVITGSAFATNTMDSIFDTAASNGTDLHFYLETGNNFGPDLIRRGAKSVVAEKFPFYDLPGTTTFEVYSR